MNGFIQTLKNKTKDKIIFPRTKTKAVTNDLGKDLDTLLKELETKFDNLKKSVSDGKSLLATSITKKKVPTQATDTFATMASNIDKIKLGSGNAQVGDVLSGKTFTNDGGVELTGTLALTGSATPGQVLSGSTFYSTDPKVKLTGTLRQNTEMNGYFSKSGTDNGSIFNNTKWGWYGGENGGTSDYNFDAIYMTGCHVAFVTGSAYSGAGDGQVDSYYQVKYAVNNGHWQNATFSQGVWQINKNNVTHVRVYFHIQSTDSMHRPYVSSHTIIGHV